MKNTRTLMLLTISAIFSACVSSKIDLKIPKYEDFKTFNTPRTGFSPGYVFRIGSEGKNKLIFVTQLQPNKIDTSSEVLPTIKKSWETNAFLKFLGIPNGSGSIDGKKNVSLEIAFSTAKKEQLSEIRLNDLLSKAKIDIKPESKYFIISETMAFDSINYKVVNYSNINTSAKGKIKTLEIEGKVAHLNNDSTNLVQKFKVPHRIFYKILQFNEKGIMLNNTKENFEFKNAPELRIDD